MDAIYDHALGDPDALAIRIIGALARAGYRIVSRSNIVAMLEDSARGSQPFDALTPEKRPQDTYGDGRDWMFKTGEHGGDEPDNMPHMIEATDAVGRWAIYVPLTRGGKIVVPRSYSATVIDFPPGLPLSDTSESQ
jgi:hypothetical protein